MDIGDRIKKRREELGMSQEELAKKVGYKSRSSVNKIEIDGRGLPQNKIVIFAKALETTPAYLMGWETISDEDIGNAFANDNLFEVINNISALSPQEKNHFTSYLQLLEINRKKADNYVEQLLSIQEMDEALQADAANARTDIDIPDGTDTSDNDIMDDDNF
ncbi:MAG TPA: helix-turn-helix domain-containing protein [Candidatus Mediterraneibacter surreyensis]|nr:helix-turn-helix domain-containing protein [Candidatus Mediterraneibacter surreyensis]